MAYYGKIATLPVINKNIKIFGIKTDLSAGLTYIPLQIIKVMYGSVTLLTQDTVIVGDSNPVGLVCLVTDVSITETVLVYFNAISVPTLPDNFSRLVQKIPKGVFEEVTPATADNVGDPQGWDFKARSQLLDDYYNNAYLPLYDNLYSRILTSDLIYEYTSNTNFTSNVIPAPETPTTPIPKLVFNSVYPNQLALLMASVLSVGLNQYDLSLFVSRYIYYRTGIPTTVLLDTSINNYEYMRLAPEGDITTANSWSVLAPEPAPPPPQPQPSNPRNQPIVSPITFIQDKPDITSPYGWTNYYSTIAPQLIGSAYLAAEGYQPVLNNLRWYINSENDNLVNMINELQALINNISRGDIGNILFINNSPFTLTAVGYTYKLDPRFVLPVGVLSAIQYIGDEYFPENIELYQLGANNG